MKVTVEITDRDIEINSDRVREYVYNLENAKAITETDKEAIIIKATKQIITNLFTNTFPDYLYDEFRSLSESDDFDEADYLIDDFLKRSKAAHDN